jgi:FKBP-type peptidyl-prolyl cis-trans isomerase 2
MTSKKAWPGILLCLLAGGSVVFGNSILCAQQTGPASVNRPAEKPEGSGSGGAAPAAVKAADAGVKAGDLVEVNYTVTLEDGTLVYSTLASVAGDTGRKKAVGYKEPKTFGPEEIVAGKPARLPGIGQSVTGMLAGQRKAVKIPPESAFGLADPGKTQTYPSVKTFPSLVRMAPPEFVGRFRVFPVQGKEVQFTEFLKARVTEVSEKSASLELIVKDGEKHSEGYGAVEVRRKGDEVVVTLMPLIGAPFKTEGGEGRIAGSDGKSFTVDFNPPLAGKTIIATIETTVVTRASELADVQIPWIEDHDKGLLAAKEAGKPAVMLLYADWCHWCKKLQSDTFPDARIKVLKDRLFFIRVNSDKQKELQKKYEQKGFPLVILFNGKGQVAGRIDGYKDAAELRETLDGLIDSGKAG